MSLVALMLSLDGRSIPLFYERREQVVGIHINDGGRSLTNSAEEVVRALSRSQYLKEGDRLVYRDTEGCWDEMQVQKGVFVGFRYLGATSMDDAVLFLGIAQPGWSA